MFNRTQTINGVEYSYHYGGNGTIAITTPIQSTIDLKQLPEVEVQHQVPVSDEQKEHLSGALQTIVDDMFAQMPRG